MMRMGKVDCLKYFYFGLKPLSSASAKSVRMSSVGLWRSGTDLFRTGELSAEEVYLLDKRTSIEIASVVGL